MILQSYHPTGPRVVSLDDSTAAHTPQAGLLFQNSQAGLVVLGAPLPSPRKCLAYYEQNQGPLKLAASPATIWPSCHCVLLG
mmetsp:Transcript_59/g.98  ORF Transcript_59/g.98 Transcript_59/m.98 type:complete len:82 (-) Transcript_59:766-1011(-)